jgi:hypothetical protein
LEPSSEPKPETSRKYLFPYQQITKKQVEKQEIGLSGIEFVFDLFGSLADCAQRLNKLSRPIDLTWVLETLDTLFLKTLFLMHVLGVVACMF